MIDPAEVTPLALIRLVLAKLSALEEWRACQRSYDGLFYEASNVADATWGPPTTDDPHSLSQAKMAAVNHARHAIAHAMTGVDDALKIRGWEREKPRTHEEGLVVLRAAQARLENGDYSWNEHCERIYTPKKPEVKSGS